MKQLLLLRSLFRRQAPVGSRGEFLLELIDSASSVNVFQLARIERVTLVANVNFQLRANALGLKLVAATTGDRGILILRVDALFHNSFSVFRGGDSGLVQGHGSRNVRYRYVSVQGL
jgi:hypothetical protein